MSLFITFWPWLTGLETSIVVLTQNELMHHFGENPVPWHQRSREEVVKVRDG